MTLVVGDRVDYHHCRDELFWLDWMSEQISGCTVFRVGSHVVFAWIHCTDVRIHCTDILIEFR